MPADYKWIRVGGTTNSDHYSRIIYSCKVTRLDYHDGADRDYRVVQWSGDLPSGHVEMQGHTFNGDSAADELAREMSRFLGACMDCGSGLVLRPDDIAPIHGLDDDDGDAEAEVN